jgi:hypothetical protein
MCIIYHETFEIVVCKTKHEHHQAQFCPHDTLSFMDWDYMSWIAMVSILQYISL